MICRNYPPLVTLPTLNVDYSQGRGFYTTHTDVSQLLQIAAFSSSTTPSIAEVGSLIKRAEERVDDIVDIPIVL